MSWDLWILAIALSGVIFIVFYELGREGSRENMRLDFPNHTELPDSDLAGLLEKIFKKVSGDWSRLAAAAKNLGWEYNCKTDKSLCKLTCKAKKGNGDIVFVFHTKTWVSVNPLVFYIKMEEAEREENIKKLLNALL